MDDKKIDKLINEALKEDLSLPKGLSERLERRIDFLAQDSSLPQEKTLSRTDNSLKKTALLKRSSFYWISGIAAAILGGVLLIFTETNHPGPRLADTYSDPQEAAIVAQDALAFMSENLNKGLVQMDEAGKEITKINKILHKHLND